MEEKKEPRAFLLMEGELAALQDFISSLNLPWKQTNPYMQLLMNAKAVKVQTESVKDTPPPLLPKME